MGFSVSTVGMLETMDHILLWSETQEVLNVVMLLETIYDYRSFANFIIHL